MDERNKALEILRDALAQAADIAMRRYADPVMGEWYRRADQRTVYESAVERAIEVLEKK